MKSLLVLLSVLAAFCALSVPSQAGVPQAVLSWGSSCPTLEKNVNFAPGTYTLWIGVKNLDPVDVLFGSDIWLEYGPGVADAWRFDDAGCQTGSGVDLNNKPNSPGCPALLGTNPLSITDFHYDPVSQKMSVRLACVFDDFTPTSGVNYTIWNLVFNHTSSIAGTDANDATCDHAEQPLCISMHEPTDPNQPSYIGLVNGTYDYFTFANPSDQFVSWNMGCSPVPVQPATWGRVKGLYR